MNRQFDGLGKGWGLPRSTKKATQRTMASRKLILVLDDDTSVLRAVGRLLTMRGFAVETFSTVDGLMGCSNLNQAACLVLDINLNGVSGIEVKRRLMRAGT